MASINSKSFPRSSNNKLVSHQGGDEGWVIVASTVTFPNLLPLLISTALLKYLFFPTVLSTSILVIFLWKLEWNLLEFLKEFSLLKYSNYSHVGFWKKCSMKVKKQNLSKTLVRHELFCAFQVGMLQQFLVLISLGKILLRRGLCWGRNKKQNQKTDYKQKRWNLRFLSLVLFFHHSFPKNFLTADSENVDHRQYC